MAVYRLPNPTSYACPTRRCLLVQVGDRKPNSVHHHSGDSDIQTTSLIIKCHHEYSRRLTTLTGGPQEHHHQRQYVNRHNPAPCSSWFFSSTAFPHRSAHTNPLPHPQAPSPTFLPTQASSYSSWAVVAAVEEAVEYVELNAAVRCGEAWICLSSRVGTRLAKRDLKTVRLDARQHAGSTLAWEFFGQIYRKNIVIFLQRAFLSQGWVLMSQPLGQKHWASFSSR